MSKRDDALKRAEELLKSAELDAKSFIDTDNKQAKAKVKVANGYTKLAKELRKKP